MERWAWRWNCCCGQWAGRGVHSVQSVGGELEIEEAMAGHGGSCGPAQEVGPHPGDTAELNDKSDLWCAENKSQTPDSTVRSPRVWAPAPCSLVSLNGTPVTHCAPAPLIFLPDSNVPRSPPALGICSHSCSLESSSLAHYRAGPIYPSGLSLNAPSQITVAKVAVASHQHHHHHFLSFSFGIPYNTNQN